MGIAVSDRSGTIASPLTVVQRSGNRGADHRRIALLVAEEEAEIVVVGLPLNMNGSAGPAARAAVAEAEALATVVGVPVTTFDERRTTVTADQALMAFKMKADAPARRRQGRRRGDAAELARGAAPIAGTTEAAGGTRPRRSA
ncbi:MAG: Holliday junction resolvase RuvX [Ilumatobacteraceae bacterium]